MGLSHPAITNFAGGQVSPLMAARVDSDAYGTMVDTLENMVVQRQGGIRKRQGTYYIQELDDSTKNCRLIPFQFSTAQAYILEFTDLLMRVYKDGGIVLDGSVPFELVTPYAHGEVAGLKFVQSADTMFLVHPDHMPYELTRADHDDWSISAMVPEWGPFLDENETAITMTPSAVTGAGIDLVASAAGFSYGEAGFNANHIGSLWKISGKQTSSASISAQNTWVTALEIDAGQAIVISLSGTWVATVTLQRSFDAGGTWVDYITYTSNASTEVIEARDDVQYRLGVDTGDYTSGTVVAELAIPEQSGYLEITAVTDTTNAVATVIEDLPSTSAVATWSEGAWSDLRGYPRAIAFYELRLVLAATSTHPQTLWSSRIDDFTNFETGTLDSNAWTYQLAAENVNSIMSLVTGDILYIMTAGGEWRIGSRDQATTPTNVTVHRESTDGAYDTQAFKAGHVVFFVLRSGRAVHMMVYNYRIDGWETHDVSFVAEDLLSGGIEEMLIFNDPDDTMVLRGTNGSLVFCNYDLRNSTFAYSLHEIGGDATTVVESMATIPGADYDEVWLLVKRTVNSSVVRYVEQIQTHVWTDHADAIFVDCALTYDGAATDSLSGLDHLEGETVDILGDGAAHAQKTVASGAITLDREVSVAHVGYGYTAKMKTLQLEVKREDGTAQARPIDAIDVSARLYKTIGMDISTDDTNFEPVPFRDPSMEMDEAVDPFTGDTANLELEAVDDYRSVQISLRNTQPLPFNLLGFFPTLRT